MSTRGLGVGAGWIALWLALVALGGWLLRDGPITWDSAIHYRQSVWIVHRLFGGPLPEVPALHHKLYGQLWELVLGIFTEYLLAWLRDPIPVRQALSFSFIR